MVLVLPSRLGVNSTNQIESTMSHTWTIHPTEGPAAPINDRCWNQSRSLRPASGAREIGSISARIGDIKDSRVFVSGFWHDELRRMNSRRSLNCFSTSATCSTRRQRVHTEQRESRIAMTYDLNDGHTSK